MGANLEIKKEKVPWIPLAILTAVLSFLTMASFSLLGTLAGSWQCGYNLGMVSRVTCFVVWPYLLLILMYPFRKRFNVSNSLLTSLWAVGNVASYTLGFAFGAIDYPIKFAFAALIDTKHIFTDLWWQPPMSAVRVMAAGNAVTDWAQWGPTILVVSLQYITFFFFTSSIVLLFRHVWLDVEQIPFPLALSGYEIVKRVESGGGGVKVEGSAKPSYMNPFWIGIILALVFEIPIFMARTFPWAPDIFNWRAACPSGAVHSSATDIIGQTLVGYTGYSMDAITLAMALLVPLSVSFNVWFWTIVMWILDQIAYATGSFTGILSMDGSGRMCCATNSLGFTGPFQWNMLAMVGGFLALAAMQIFQHRKYLLITINAAVGKQKPDWEKNEVMNYRSNYAMLVLSIVGCIISCALLGISLLPALLLIAFNCFTTWLAMLMLFGYGAFGASDCRIWPHWPLRIVWPTAPAEPTTDFIMSNMWAGWGSNVVSFGFGNGYFTTALGLKMSALTGTSNKNAFWVGAMATIIAVPVLWATRVWFANLYGSRVGGSVGYSWDAGTSCISYLYSLPSNADYALYGAAGFVIVTALSILHARFLWFPFEPIGYIIATNFGGFWNNLWSVFLVAWVIKAIVLRVGGSKLYSGMIIPGVGGFAAGVAIGTLFGSMAGMLRFFVPF